MQSMFTTSSPCLCGRGGRDGLVHDFIGGYSSIDATRKDQRGGPSPSTLRPTMSMKCMENMCSSMTIVLT